ncbi:hypothetical protein ES705_38809 [subsurface metagenome]
MPDRKRLTQRLVEIHRETYKDACDVAEGVQAALDRDTSFINQQTAVAMEAFRWTGYAIDQRPASAMYKAVFKEFSRLLEESWNDGFRRTGMYLEADFEARAEAMLNFFSKDGKTIAKLKPPPATPPFALPRSG